MTTNNAPYVAPYGPLAIQHAIPAVPEQDIVREGVQNLGRTYGSQPEEVVRLANRLAGGNAMNRDEAQALIDQGRESWPWQ